MPAYTFRNIDSTKLTCDTCFRAAHVLYSEDLTAASQLTRELASAVASRESSPDALQRRLVIAEFRRHRSITRGDLVLRHRDPGIGERRSELLARPFNA